MNYRSRNCVSQIIPWEIEEYDNAVKKEQCADVPLLKSAQQFGKPG